MFLWYGFSVIDLQRFIKTQRNIAYTMHINNNLLIYKHVYLNKTNIIIKICKAVIDNINIIQISDINDVNVSIHFNL